MRLASQESNLERLALIQGLLVGLSPLPFVLFDVAAPLSQFPAWLSAIPFAALAVSIFTAIYPFRNWKHRRLFGTTGIVLASSVLYPLLPDRPDITLALLVIVAIAYMSLFEQNVAAHYARRLSRLVQYNISLNSGVISFGMLQAAILFNG